MNNNVISTATSNATKTTDTPIQNLTKAPKINKHEDSFVSINSKVTPTSDIDMDKVNQVSALLAEGKLSLDLDVLTNSIVEMHRR